MNLINISVISKFIFLIFFIFIYKVEFLLADIYHGKKGVDCRLDHQVNANDPFLLCASPVLHMVLNPEFSFS